MKRSEFFKNKKNRFLLGTGIFVLIIAIVAAATIDSITIYAPSPDNNSVTADTTPEFNFSVAGSEESYSCRLNLCMDNYSLLAFNTTGDLIVTEQCSQNCDFSCSCDSSEQAYKIYNCSGDLIYVDCVHDKCWTATAGTTYTWGVMKQMSQLIPVLMLLTGLRAIIATIWIMAALLTGHFQLKTTCLHYAEPALELVLEEKVELAITGLPLSTMLTSRGT